MKSIKKFLPILVIVVGALLTFVVLNAGKKDDTSKSGDSQSSQQVNYVTKQACELFTLDDAKKVLGNTAVKSEDAGTGGASSDDIEVSQCFYQLPAGEDISSITNQKQASLLVRSAKTKTGADSNKDYFVGATKPENVQDVSDYGDAAFWSTDYGQLNILKGDQWYILQVGSAALTSRTQDDAKKMADVLISKL